MVQDLTDLWSSDWFMRCWVTQEMVLAEDVVCLYGYGAKKASWSLDTLTMLIERSQNVQHTHRDAYKIGGSFNTLLLEKVIKVDAWRLMRSEMRKQDSKGDFLDLLHRSRRTKATDQRDKVYSLLGLMKDEERAAIKVDYSPDHTVTDVFMDVAKYWESILLQRNIASKTSSSRQPYNVSRRASYFPGTPSGTKTGLRF